MTLSAYFHFLTRNPRFILSTACKIADVIFIKIRSKFIGLPKYVYEARDTEEKLFNDRAGWLIDEIRTNGSVAATKKYEAVVAAENLSNDSYSCSQRLAKSTYLLRLIGRESFPHQLLEFAHKDAAILVKHHEFRLNNIWFNNHLLNNYRALLLYASYFESQPGGINSRASIATIEHLLKKNMDTLFGTPGLPVLTEGSVSYEIHGLKILVDIACCTCRTGLADEFREWIVRSGKYVCLKYRSNDSWIIPHIGDLTPNWTTNTMLDFLDGFALSSNSSVYRKIWSEQLSDLGL